MLSELGNLFVLISIILSFSLIVFSTKELKYIRNPISPKIKNFSILQLIFANLCFFVLLLGYLFSDFSMENVYENSHTAKPLLYKISGVWGNHEGSLLLWINVLVLFSFLFFVKNIKTDKKFLLITQIFQNIIILGFFIFLLTTSNPFNRIFPIPEEGLGLNPILQDPALAIHPPLLVFVGSSIYFSTALSSLISKFGEKNFAWFQTMGISILVISNDGNFSCSIWACYELGWGGYWFWDPVENSSNI